MSFIVLDFERFLPTSVAAVRTEVADALRRLGFDITTEQITLVEARRGSQLAAAALQMKKLPIGASARFAANDDGCGVAVRLEDRWRSPIGKTWGINSSYEGLFTDIQQRIDAGLARLDASAGASFPEPRFWSAVRTVGLLERGNVASGRVGGTVTEKADKALQGGRKDRPPDAWKDVEQVLFEAPEGVAALGLEDAQARLTVAVLVASQPGSMPEQLAADLERFAARVEEMLLAAPPGVVHVPVAPDEVPVFEFLDQQARIRDGLPLRTLHACRDCKFQKVVNPDYKKLRERNQRLRALGGGVGMSLRGGTISPFVLVGTLFRMRKLDPDFVCPRCQGMDSDTFIVTFCPSCGDRRDEAVLRTCRKCGHDLRHGHPVEGVWQQAAREVASTNE